MFEGVAVLNSIVCCVFPSPYIQVSGVNVLLLYCIKCMRRFQIGHPKKLEVSALLSHQVYSY